MKFAFKIASVTLAFIYLICVGIYNITLVRDFINREFLGVVNYVNFAFGGVAATLILGWVISELNFRRISDSMSLSSNNPLNEHVSSWKEADIYGRSLEGYQYADEYSAAKSGTKQSAYDGLRRVDITGKASYLSERPVYVPRPSPNGQSIDSDFDFSDD